MKLKNKKNKKTAALSGVFLGPPLGRRAAELQGKRGGPWVWAGGCSVVAARPAAGTHSWAGASPVMLRARLSRRAASGDGHRPPASDAGGFGLSGFQGLVCNFFVF